MIAEAVLIAEGPLTKKRNQGKERRTIFVD